MLSEPLRERKPLMKVSVNSYYPYFDYLRIVLVSIVMFGHDDLIAWNYSGKLAVDVFFSLSGFLIGGILLRTEISTLPKFYFNRALRIWVPYYIALILIIIASILKDPINLKWFEFLIYKFTWVYNIFGPPQLEACKACMPLDGSGNHFWSVNAEEQFYLLAPLLLVVFENKGRQLITWFLIVMSLWFMKVYAPISFGVLAAIVNSKYPGFYITKLSRFLLLLIFIGSTIGLSVTFDYAIYSPLFSICLVLLLAIKGEKGAIGSFLGGVSYPLYLNHWIGVFFFNLVLDPFGLRDSGIRHLLSAIMNYGIAAFLYWYVEKRVLDMREQLYTIKRGIVFTNIAYFSVAIGLIFGFILSPSLNVAIFLAMFLTTTYLVINAVFQKYL